MKLIAAVLAAVVTLAPAAGAGVDATQAKSVTVTLSEWKLVPSVKRVPAGKVTFVVKNAGKLVHELVLVRTNVAPGKLPTANGVAKVKALAAVRNVGPGQTKRLTMTLKSGRYALLCNLPAHYQSGQYAGLVVG